MLTKKPILYAVAYLLYLIFSTANIAYPQIEAVDNNHSTILNLFNRWRKDNGNTYVKKAIRSKYHIPIFREITPSEVRLILEKIETDKNVLNNFINLYEENWIKIDMELNLIPYSFPNTWQVDVKIKPSGKDSKLEIIPDNSNIIYNENKLIIDNKHVSKKFKVCAFRESGDFTIGISGSAMRSKDLRFPLTIINEYVNLGDDNKHDFSYYIPMFQPNCIQQDNIFFVIAYDGSSSISRESREYYSQFDNGFEELMRDRKIKNKNIIRIAFAESARSIDSVHDINDVNDVNLGNRGFTKFDNLFNSLSGKDITKEIYKKLTNDNNKKLIILFMLTDGIYSDKNNQQNLQDIKNCKDCFKNIQKSLNDLGKAFFDEQKAIIFVPIILPNNNDDEMINFQKYWSMFSSIFASSSYAYDIREDPYIQIANLIEDISWQVKLSLHTLDLTTKDNVKLNVEMKPSMESEDNYIFNAENLNISFYGKTKQERKSFKLSEFFEYRPNSPNIEIWFNNATNDGYFAIKSIEEDKNIFSTSYEWKDDIEIKQDLFAPVLSIRSSENLDDYIFTDGIIKGTDANYNFSWKMTNTGDISKLEFKPTNFRFGDFFAWRPLQIYGAMLAINKNDGNMKIMLFKDLDFILKPNRIFLVILCSLLCLMVFVLFLIKDTDIRKNLEIVCSALLVPIFHIIFTELLQIYYWMFITTGFVMFIVLFNKFIVLFNKFISSKHVKNVSHFFLIIIYMLLALISVLICFLPVLEMIAKFKSIVMVLLYFVNLALIPIVFNLDKFKREDSKSKIKIQ